MGQLELLAGRTSYAIGRNFAHASKAKLFVSAGGACASWLRARNVINGVKADIKDQIEPYDLQWLIGADAEIQGVLVAVRYTRGMRNINAKAAAPKITTDRLGLSVVYGF